ncbi:hypothetical protein BGX26_001558 [Mortierella sp. AD094]|nr:hypothetical protein BGX26_001558 [Mortierella sp. AD094]
MDLDSKISRIGFVGLGNMGLPMATNLFKGYKHETDFIIYDVNQTATSTFLKHHNTYPNLKHKIKVATSPLEVAQEASVIFTMLPAPPEIESVYFGKDGFLEALGPNHLVVDTSTIGKAMATRVAEVLNKKGARAVDAPCSGCTPGAHAGTLTFMVGSSSDDFDLAKPYLEKMGKNVVYCGANGSGQAVKICNNMLAGVTMIATSEAMNLGVRMGVDPKLLTNIINMSSGRCWMTDMYNPCPGVLENSPATHGYKGGLRMPLMVKDISLAVDAAAETESTVLLGAMAQQLYKQLASKEEYKDLDISATYKWLSENAE